LPDLYESAKKIPTFLAFGPACLAKKYPIKKNAEHRAMGNVVIDNEQGFFVIHYFLSFFFYQVF
jgi:hypothetical protein